MHDESVLSLSDHIEKRLVDKPSLGADWITLSVEQDSLKGLLAANYTKLERLWVTAAAKSYYVKLYTGHLVQH